MDESVQFNTYKNVLDNMTFQPANDTVQDSIKVEKEKVYMKPVP